MLQCQELASWPVFSTHHSDAPIFSIPATWNITAVSMFYTRYLNLNMLEKSGRIAQNFLTYLKTAK